jgi:predicted ester cyclase
MGIEENKAVVRAYLTGIHAVPPDLTVFDDLLAPEYQRERAGVKAPAVALDAAISGQAFDFQDLIGEGDAVVARFDYSITLRDGSVANAHGFAHCRLEDGKIVAQDVATSPDLGPVFDSILAVDS